MGMPMTSVAERPFGLEPKDLEALLATEPARWVGRIMELNRGPEYHNSLNAVVLIGALQELVQNAQAMRRALTNDR